MSKQWDNLVEKLGSEEAARAEMKRRADKSKRNLGGSGGFAKMKVADPERFKEISSNAGKASRRRSSTHVDISFGSDNN